MKISLIRPAYSSVVYSGIYKSVPKNHEVRPPLGLAYLAAVLEKEGHSVEIIDGEPELFSLEETIEKIKNSKPDFVGITSTSPEFPFAMNILRSVKDYNPAVITMLGGAHASALPEETINENPQVDYLVVGEGEKNIVKIVNEQPSEKILYQSEMIDVNHNVWPARHLLDYRNYKYAYPGKGMIRTDAMESARGCFGKCNFCFRLQGRKVRLRDPIDVVDELEKSYKDNKIEMIVWFDETFTLKKERAHIICDEMIKRGIKVNSFCGTRADRLDKDVLKHMKEAGFTKITLGIETGNQDMLTAIGKETKLEQYEQAFKWMIELGIETRGSFILGHPYETKETIQDTLNFAKKLPLVRAGFNILTPYPGTKVYEMAIKGEGLHLLCQDWKQFRRWGNSVIKTPELSSEDLMNFQKKCLREFYTQSSVLAYHKDQLEQGNKDEYYHRPIMGAIDEQIKFSGNGKIKNIEEILNMKEIYDNLCVSS